MNINEYIDHTLLKQDQTKNQLDNLIKEAITFNFAAVCVSQDNVSYVANKLQDTSVNTCTVIGFPLGNNTTKTKVFEALDAISNGACEIDMVVNVSKVKDKNWKYVENDIKEVNDAVHTKGKILKVIFENCLLTKEQIVKLCEICVKLKVDFVKTSTGFSTGGATFEDVKLMKSIVEDKVLIKAAGGVKTKEDATKMIELGVSRIGTSNGVSIIKGETSGDTY